MVEIILAVIRANDLCDIVLQAIETESKISSKTYWTAEVNTCTPGEHLFTLTKGVMHVEGSLTLTKVSDLFTLKEMLENESAN